MADPRYDDREAMAPPPDHRWTLMLAQIPEGSRVLELGCGRGYAAVAMAGKGCTVVGIELDVEAAAEARARCQRVLVGDLAELLESPELADGSFDVIVAADVLEHLVDPVLALRRCRRLLADGGFVLASIPNATHASVILTLCDGRFPWEDEGLFDRTHLHQFGEDSALGLFARAGYRAAIVARRRLDPRNTELRSSLDDVPDEVLRFLDRNPNADTYQFILRGEPCRDEQTVGIAPTPRTAETAAPLRSALVQEVADLRSELRRYHEAALAREADVERLNAEVARAREEAGAALDRELADHRAELAYLRAHEANDPTTARPRTTSLGAGEIRPRTLFVAADGDAPARYRCVHAAEQLRRDGCRASVLRVDDPGVTGELDRANVLVLFRLPWSETVERLVERARKRGVRIVFDTDDLVFEPERIDCLTFLDRLPPCDREYYEEHLPRVRRTFDESDHVIAATVPLAAHARLLGKPADVHPNVVSPRDQSRAAALRLLRAVASPSPLIGYASGSHTHDEDFSWVAPAIARALERHHEARLLLCGFVNLPGDLARLGDRVTRLPYLDHPVYAWALARCRVVLSPAATINAFTNAKSPMKLLEAGVLDVPTIATPTHAYAELLLHGWNGWLARSEEDWLASLEEALDARRSREVGGRARATVVSRLSFAAQSGRLRHLLARLLDPSTAPPDATPGATGLGMTGALGEDPAARGIRARLRRVRQRWFLLRRGDVGPETLRIDVTDWWREERSSLIEPSAFEKFVVASQGRWRIDGWEPNGDLRRIRRGSYESTGIDPQLVRGGLKIDPRLRRFLVVRQRTSADAVRPTAQLFFATADEHFSEDASVRFPLVPDGAWHTYVLDLVGTSWPREAPLGTRIAALRYDPSTAAGAIDVQFVGLLPEALELLVPASTALRTRLAERHLRGRGAEFGALQNPLALPDGVQAFYVDQLTHEKARAHYPELEGQPLTPPSIVGDVASLPIRSESLDFAIANHLLEHAKDPIGALQEIVRVVRPGGVVFASVPDVGNPLDRGRAVTPIEHLLADHTNGHDRSAEDATHYHEATASSHPGMPAAELAQLVARRSAEGYSVHFHTFDERSFRWLLDEVGERSGVEVAEFARNRVGDWDEYVAILRRRRRWEREAS